MAPIRITTKLESETLTLTLPELRPLIGKTVEIRVVETAKSAFDRLEDHEYLAAMEAELAADPSPIPTLEEVRAIMARIPGNLSADCIAERDER